MSCKCLAMYMHGLAISEMTGPSSTSHADKMHLEIGQHLQSDVAAEEVLPKRAVIENDVAQLASCMRHTPSVASPTPEVDKVDDVMRSQKGLAVSMYRSFWCKAQRGLPGKTGGIDCTHASDGTRSRPRVSPYREAG